MAETCFLAKRSGFDSALALQFIERNVGQLPVVLQDEINALSRLFKRHENVPASLTDASLILLAAPVAAPVWGW